MESKTRSFLKAFTYRFGGLIGTGLIIWIVTGRIDWAAYASATDTVIKIICFYLHERIWQKISYGKEHIEYQI